MASLILLPDGNAVSPAVIRSVFHFAGKGVMCRDAQNRLITYIKVANDDHGRRVRDLLIKASSSVGSTQPDWSFLLDESSN